MDTQQQEERLTLTVNEVAHLLGLSRGTTYEAVRTGQIPSIRIGQRVIIPRVALIKMLEEAVKGKIGSDYSG